MAIAGMQTIENSEDVLDSRDIRERIDWLETCHDGCRVPFPVAQEQDDAAGECPDPDEHEELTALLALKEDVEQNAGEGWDYGVTMIRDSYFRDYAEELARDVGAISEKEQWPLNCIDWDQAVQELQQDYSQVEFDGVTYWVRS